jgi:hypothetical protein
MARAFRIILLAGGMFPALVSDTPEREYEDERNQQYAVKAGESRAKLNTQPKTIWRSTNWNISGSMAMSRFPIFEARL